LHNIENEKRLLVAQRTLFAAVADLADAIRHGNHDDIEEATLSLMVDTIHAEVADDVDSAIGYICKAIRSGTFSPTRRDRVIWQCAVRCIEAMLKIDP
jgi:hypothetical protein